MLHSDFLFYDLSEVPTEKRERLKERLAVQPRDTVLALYGRELWKGNRKQVWLLGEELTRRGIPPAFRRSPLSASGGPLIPEEDIFLLDLQWLAGRYPAHRSLLKYFPRPFTPSRFEAAAMWMLRNGLRQPAFYLKVLALREDQQVECSYLRGEPIRRRMEVVHKLSAEALERLKLANRTNRRARAQEAVDWKQTVQRRHDIWLCGSMADWQPKRTAELYEALTGTQITRSLAGKIISEVHRDFPMSKPPARRKRRRKPAKATGVAAMGRASKIRKGKPRRVRAGS